jgi:hypothetical protein
MKAYLHVKPSGEIVGMHKIYRPKARVVFGKEEDTIEVELSDSMAKMSFAEFAKSYTWHSARRQIVKK